MLLVMFFWALSRQLGEMHPKASQGLFWSTLRGDHLSDVFMGDS